jgi:general secretion pathway protein G
MTGTKDIARTAAGRRAYEQSGFTLLELIIVVAVIGILATIALPRMLDTPKKAAEATLKTNLRTLRDNIDQYYADKGHYPATLETLVDEGYLRGVPLDPITKSNETWKVEYEEIDFDEEAAETDLPESGEPGIIDVHSGAAGTALDGSLYSEW